MGQQCVTSQSSQNARTVSENQDNSRAPQHSWNDSGDSFEGWDDLDDAGMQPVQTQTSDADYNESVIGNAHKETAFFGNLCEGIPYNCDVHSFSACNDGQCIWRHYTWLFEHGILVSFVHRPLCIYWLQYKVMNAPKPENEANASPAHELLHPISLIPSPFYLAAVGKKKKKKNGDGMKLHLIGSLMSKTWYGLLLSLIHRWIWQSFHRHGRL